MRKNHRLVGQVFKIVLIILFLTFG